MPRDLIAALARAHRALARPHPWRGAPCLLCGAGRTPGGLCAPCRADLVPWPADACRRCARPLAAPGDRCGDCARAAPAHGPVTAAGAYAWPLAAVVRAFKFRGDLSLAAPLATLVAEAVETPPARALLVPVPLGRARAAARGYNPAAELARRLSREFGLPWDPDLLVRMRETAPQSSLPRSNRTSNVEGAFAVRRSLPGARVILVDDVLTTGATASAAARALTAAGASDLATWVVARAPPPA